MKTFKHGGKRGGRERRKKEKGGDERVIEGKLRKGRRVEEGRGWDGTGREGR